MKVLILTHPQLVPPLDRTHYKSAVWRPEHEIERALKRMGHEPKTLGIFDELKKIEQMVKGWEPSIAFNLLEEFSGEAGWDCRIPTYLESLSLPYTGCGAQGLRFSRDKGRAKRFLVKHGVPTPKFKVFRRGKPFQEANLRFPCFVKSLTEEASFGISRRSIVQTQPKLKERITFIHEKTESDALVEEYVEGGDIYVGVMGNESPRALPVWEMKFLKIPNVPRIATRSAKFTASYQKRHGITSGEATRLKRSRRQEIQALAVKIYRLLGLRGYARMDFRIDNSKNVFFLEANPNPHLGQEEDFSQSARKAGMKYPKVLSEILRLGLRAHAGTQLRGRRKILV